MTLKQHNVRNRQILLAAACLLLGWLLLGQYVFAAENTPDICPTNCYQATVNINSYEVNGNPSGDIHAKWNGASDTPFSNTFWRTNGDPYTITLDPQTNSSYALDGYSTGSFTVTGTSPANCNLAKGSYENNVCTSVTLQLDGAGTYSAIIYYCKPGVDCPRSFFFGVTPTGDVQYTMSFLQTVTGTYGIKAGELEGAFQGSQQYLTDADMHTAGFYPTEFIVNLGIPTNSDIVTAVQNYPDVHLWVVFNEPEGCGSGQNCLSPGQTASDLKTIYPEILHADSLAIVIAPNLTCFKKGYYESTECNNWLTSFMNDLGTGTYFDAIGEHFYPTDIYNNQNDIANVTEGLQKIDSILDNKPMYITETGINNSNYQTEAENLVMYYNIFTNQSFIQGAYWYRMTDKGQSGSYWGLFTSSYSPKTDATSYEDYINAYES